MLRTPSIFGPLNSGFVPFASGAPIDAAAEAETETAEVIARVSAPTVETAAPVEVVPSAAWAPSFAARKSRLPTRAGRPAQRLKTVLSKPKPK